MDSWVKARYSSALSDIDVIDCDAAVTLILNMEHHGSINLIGSNRGLYRPSD